MGQNKRKIGSEYESIAGAYLEKQGYEILEYNVYSRAGEIDIVARDGQYLVFVEVKFRRDDYHGQALEAVSYTKQKNISKCALSYLNKHRLWNVPVRFDVIGIMGQDITLIKNAFEFCGNGF